MGEGDRNFSLGLESDTLKLRKAVAERHIRVEPSNVKYLIAGLVAVPR
jgi:hypothetical protein